MSIVFEMIDFVLKTMDFDITNDEFCIENDELCIVISDFILVSARRGAAKRNRNPSDTVAICIKLDELCIKNDRFIIYIDDCLCMVLTGVVAISSQINEVLIRNDVFCIWNADLKYKRPGGWWVRGHFRVIKRTCAYVHTLEETHTDGWAVPIKYIGLWQVTK